MTKDELVKELINEICIKPKDFHEHLRITDIKPAEISILFLLHSKENEKPIKICDLAKMLSVSPSTVTPSLNSLENNKYIKRIMSKEDRRIWYVETTKKGKEFVEFHSKKMFVDFTEMVDFLGEEDTYKFLSILKRVFEFKKKKIEEKNIK